MSPKNFKKWRKRMKFSQKSAAEALGLKPRMIQYYEKGERNGEKVKVPTYISLACAALQYGVRLRDDDDDD